MRYCSIAELAPLLDEDLQCCTEFKIFAETSGQSCDCLDQSKSTPRSAPTRGLELSVRKFLGTQVPGANWPGSEKAYPFCNTFHQLTTFDDVHSCLVNRHVYTADKPLSLEHRTLRLRSEKHLHQLIDTTLKFAATTSRAFS